MGELNTNRSNMQGNQERYDGMGGPISVQHSTQYRDRDILTPIVLMDYDMFSVL